MEVHHHSHTARKKWTHYFWEFFMLFLAVTLGFFVENQREHFVEHSREKQYIKSMVADLNVDTAKLATLIRDHGTVVDGLDSILANYEQFSSGVYTRAYFKHQSALDGFTDFTYTDRTIDQLKSSGGMRLIRKQAASDSIVAYNDEVRDFLLEQEGLQRVFEMVSDDQLKILNLRLLREEFKKDRKKLATDKTIDLLLTHDKQTIESYYNKIDMYRITLAAKRQVAAALKRQATRLIKFLEDQYHLN